MKIAAPVFLFFACVGLLFSSSVQGEVFILGDHPDGNKAPPSYGLRLDNFDGSGVFTWQFTRPDSIAAANWQQARLVIDGTTVRISGSMYGGLTAGDVYDDASGKVGQVFLDYTYSTGVTIGGDKLIKVADDPGTSNGGSLAAVGVNWFTGPVSFFDKGNHHGTSFIFDNDGWRLGDYPEFDPLTTFVGRGWQEGVGSGTRDFLFTATAIPEPTSLMLWSALGLCLAGCNRRRRK